MTKEQYQDLFSNFPKATLQDWIDKIESDLKEKSLESLYWDITPNWSVTPWAHKDEVLEIPKLQSIKRFQNEWEVGWEADCNVSLNPNEDALKALSHGVNSILFTNISSENKISNLLRNIEMQLVSIHFEFHTFYDFTTHLDKLKSLQWNGSIRFHSGLEKLTDKDLSIYSHIIDPSYPNKYFWVEMQKDSSPINQLDQVLGKIVKMIGRFETLSPKDVLSTLGIRINLDHSFYLNIAKIRAIKILWPLLLESYSIYDDIVPELEAFYSSDLAGKDIDVSKISCAVQSMSAVIASVDRISFGSLDNDNKGHFSEDDRQLVLSQHIMKHEAYLNRVIDPSSGSYFIEKLSIELAERTWNQFINRV